MMNDIIVEAISSAYNVSNRETILSSWDASIVKVAREARAS